MMAKIDEPGLGRVEVEPVPAKPLAQHAENTLGLFEIRENQDAIVGIPHKNAVTPEARSYVPLEPLVQHVVQVDVRKQWRDDSALRGSLSGRVVQAAALQHARLQPFVDHPAYDAVRDSSVEERPQMMMLDGVVIFGDVDVQHPADPAPAHES